MANITPTQLSAAVGISLPYASQIINGRRAPARALAIHIFQRTGAKFGPISRMSDEDISTLARIEGASAITLPTEAA